MMSNVKAPFSFEILRTLDGSPTLSLSGGEKMHSMDGSFSETVFIYGSVIEKTINQANPSYLSMGLGLGYNEILAVAYAMKEKKEIKITSFEIVPELREFFSLWIDGHFTVLNGCYDEILHLCAEHATIDKHELKKELKRKKNKTHLLLLGPVTEENPTTIKYNGIFFDAFSSNTDSELWSEEFLDQFLKNYCDDQYCYFSTYAATGNLKRALQKNGFQMEKRKGYSRKRESTFAYRK